MLAKGSQDISMKGGGLTVSDVFSPYVYAGTAATQNIVNGIDLATEGGMVWFKARGIIVDNAIFDSTDNFDSFLVSNSTVASVTIAGHITPNINGFTIGSTGFWITNSNTSTYASWTFRKAPKFFDVVTYTGNGVAGREIAHDLGCDVGMLIIKDLDTSGYPWRVYHKSLGATKFMQLDNSNAEADAVTANIWNSTEPTESVFTLGSHITVNSADTHEYVAYLFAHNETDGLVAGDGNPVIKCGSYVGNTVNEVDLGCEPQYLLIKPSSNIGNWFIYDCIRGIVTGEVDALLSPNLSNSEFTSDHLTLNARGFTALGTLATSSTTYIYMAIARDTTTVPTSSDEVFAIDLTAAADTPNATSSFTVDMGLYRGLVASSNTISSRLTQGQSMLTNSTNAEAANTNMNFAYMEGYLDLALDGFYTLMFKRANSFFDVVTYTGDGVAGRTVDHNLGVVPEMIWMKDRDIVSPWMVSVLKGGAVWGTSFLEQNLPVYNGIGQLNSTPPTDSLFTLAGVGQNINNSGDSYIAYLFATLAGISKVGSYTGNGSTQTIDAGFTTGAKFIIIKRTDLAGDWIMVDTTRGLDNFLELNTTNAQASGSGIGTNSSGFTVTQNGTTDLNASGGSYIYYSVATGA